MNQKIILGAKTYVNMILGPLEDHYYHHYEHALEVMNRAIEIGKKEGLKDADLELLSIASLFHDTGFVIQYDDNEYIGANIAKNYLKSILYPEDKIEKIKELIIATIYTREPQNLLEKIIKDADTDNLGRDDFFDKGTKLKKEIETIKNIKIKDPEWMHYSINFLSEHKFLTNTGTKERDPKKRENIEKLEKKVKNYKVENL